MSARTLDVIGMADALGRGALLSARATTDEPRHGRTECAPTALRRHPGVSADFARWCPGPVCDWDGIAAVRTLDAIGVASASGD